MLNCSHMIYDKVTLYMWYQVIDIIEMCSITAMGPLRAAVLYFLDISGSCGYNIAQQTMLIHSIKFLFVEQEMTIVCNKTDLQSLDCIPAEDKKLLVEMNANSYWSGRAQKRQRSPDVVEEEGDAMDMDVEQSNKKHLIRSRSKS
ncbi:Nucleolar GTP-binding protein 1 [Bienertia sinuspersici]